MSETVFVAGDICAVFRDEGDDVAGVLGDERLLHDSGGDCGHVFLIWVVW